MYLRTTLHNSLLVQAILPHLHCYFSQSSVWLPPHSWSPSLLKGKAPVTRRDWQLAAAGGGLPHCKENFYQLPTAGALPVSHHRTSKSPSKGALNWGTHLQVKWGTVLHLHFDLDSLMYIPHTVHQKRPLCRVVNQLEKWILGQSRVLLYYIQNHHLQGLPSIGGK